MVARTPSVQRRGVDQVTLRGARGSAPRLCDPVTRRPVGSGGCIARDVDSRVEARRLAHRIGRLHPGLAVHGGPQHRHRPAPGQGVPAAGGRGVPDHGAGGTRSCTAHRRFDARPGGARPPLGRAPQRDRGDLFPRPERGRDRRTARHPGRNGEVAVPQRVETASTIVGGAFRRTQGSRLMDATKEPQHESGLLGAYVLDVLEPEERREIEEHLAGCADCRAELAELEAVKTVLDELPPEALLHGPPDADLVLQRTLRQMRSENSTQNRRGWSMAAAAAAIVLAGALGAGVAIGRGTKSSVQGAGVNPSPSVVTVTPPASPLPSGTRSGRTTDAATGATIEATVVPAAGWVRVNALVGGIPPGENCRL